MKNESFFIIENDGIYSIFNIVSTLKMETKPIYVTYGYNNKTIDYEIKLTVVLNKVDAIQLKELLWSDISITSMYKQDYVTNEIIGASFLTGCSLSDFSDFKGNLEFKELVFNIQHECRSNGILEYDVIKSQIRNEKLKKLGIYGVS